MKNPKNIKKQLLIFFLLSTVSVFNPGYSQQHCIPQGTLVIPVNEPPWIYDRTVIKNIVIPSGVTLTISNNAVINMLENATITVKVGGRLEIWGGTIQLDPTCRC